jgi:4,5-DOPA dioxygenase extradiol
MSERMPTVFFGHGSPMNTLEDHPWTRLWATIGRQMPKPRAIVSVSAHWLTRGSAVTAMKKPQTIHDFGGFPKALFEVQYPAPGDPQLAEQICEMLAPEIEVRPVQEWGLDHGTWSVLVHAFPAADVPVVQLSIDGTRAARWHFELGRRLAALREQGVLLMGSGNIVHNLQRIVWSEQAAPLAWAERFDGTIREAITRDDPDTVIDWHRLGEDAQLAVPHPDHFLPLLYVLGARSPGETATLHTPTVVMGSLTMTSVVVGGA